MNMIANKLGINLSGQKLIRKSLNEKMDAILIKYPRNSNADHFQIEAIPNLQAQVHESSELFHGRKIDDSHRKLTHSSINISSEFLDVC